MAHQIQDEGTSNLLQLTLPEFLLTSFCSSLDSVAEFLTYIKLQHIIILLP